MATQEPKLLVIDTAQALELVRKKYEFPGLAVIVVNTMWYLVMWLAPAKDFAVIVATYTGAGDTFKGCDEVAAQMIKKWCQPGD